MFGCRRTANRKSSTGRFRPTGQFVGQWHPPEWFDALHVGARREGDLGSVSGRLDVLNVADDLLTAEASYRILDDVWIQRFVARRLTEQQLIEELRRVGLQLHQWLDDGRHWFSAKCLSGPVPGLYDSQ
jgi:hypothetical protein